jgi:leucyl/phenylalanyl-tRNA---protein transferase
MPVYRLSARPEFPPAHLAEPDGLLAVGGDLSPGRLLRAYAGGIFPWYEEDGPVLWWSPDPRAVIRPGQVHIGRTLRRALAKDPFEITYDRTFRRVITDCAGTRGPGREGTWITPEMIEAYVTLHNEGHAHSVECWRNDAFAGGLYGVSLGGCFFGESMVSHQSGASKAALVALSGRLLEWGFNLIDCQMMNPHLERLGAKAMPRAAFLDFLKKSLRRPGRRGSWDISEANKD